MRLLAAREFDQVVDQQRQLLDLLDHVGEQPLALGGVHVLRRCCRISMFVRRLVTGVRSSCEASATSWRCACTEASSALIERSSASSIALKLRARRPISSSPAGSMRPLRSCVQRDVLGRLREALERQHGGAGDEPPEQRRERDAAEVQQREDQAQAAEQAVDFGQRLGELHGAAVAERLGEHAQVDAVDVRVAEERRAAVLGQRERARRRPAARRCAPSARRSCRRR